MKNVSPTGKTIPAKTKSVAVPVLLSAPVAKVNAFTAMLAATAAKETAKPVAAKPVAAKPVAAKPVASAVPAVPAFAHTEVNGRKDYRPGTTGFRIFEACDTLTAKHPNIALTAKVLKAALPDVKESSLGCGLSHWRQFRGLTKTLLAAKAAVTAK